MNRFPAVTACSCVIAVLAAGTLSAGPLDRQNVQPRTNPVTQSMIRVPGVVGQGQASAMAALQQAGLNVSVVEAKEIPKGMGGATGLEGKVVDQEPSSGGMAMYGTTVTVYVWKPGKAGAGTGDVPGVGASSWGAMPSPGGSPGFPGAQTGVPMPQQMMPPGGAMGGMQMQGSQGFQVQQYYFPEGPGNGAPPAQGQTSMPPPSADPYGNPPGVAPPGGQPMPPTVPPPGQ